MYSKKFEYEAMYSIVSRKDFRDELNDYFIACNSADALMNLSQFARTKGIETLEINAGTLVLFPRRSTRKRPACVMVTSKISEFIAFNEYIPKTCVYKAYSSTARWSASYLEAGKYDVAKSG